MTRRWAFVLVAVTGLWLLYGLVAGGPGDLVERGFGDLPVLNGGRVKPLDSVARNSLLVLSGKQSVRKDRRSVGATPWLMEMLFRPSEADTAPVFEINDPDVLGSLGIVQTGKRRFSFFDLHDHLNDIEAQANRARQVRPEQRTRFQVAVLGLFEKIVLYWRLQNTLRLTDPDERFPPEKGQAEEFRAYEAARTGPEGALKDFHARYHALAERAEFLPLPVPPESDDRWRSVGQALVEFASSGEMHPGVPAFARMGDAYRAENKDVLRKALGEYRTWLSQNAPDALAHARRERIYNRYEPFYKSLQLYLLVCLLIFLSFLRWPEGFRRAGFGLLVLAFAVHSGGLFSRVVLQGRPPVTNLYSSAIFVGWGAVLLGLILERRYRNGLASLGAAVVGFLTQIVAHHLSAQGDTMEMMRAVLDSNFWLATHVVTVTVGYSSSFLSGALGIVFVLRGLFSKKLAAQAQDNLTRMVYGIVCFTVFFSFLGTVLGGIWADQSWGRFWGWDPKENGALMIVLWNALILHVWWGKLVERRGLMILAIFGNVITALSWFGVNMLGVGLHSYGFMDKAFPWLLFFTLAHVAVIGLGALPSRFWSSPPSPSK